MERPEPPAALWGYGGHSEPQPHRTPTVTLTHAHAHFHTHILYLTHTRPHTYTQVLIHTHTHNHPGNSKAAGISQCQAREENQGHRKTSSRCAWSLQLGVPLAQGPGQACQAGSEEGGRCLHSGPEPSLLLLTFWELGAHAPRSQLGMPGISSPPSSLQPHPTRGPSISGGSQAGMPPGVSLWEADRRRWSYLQRRAS